MTTPLRVACALFFVAALSACPPPVVPCTTGAEDSCDGGTLPVDECNSMDEALGTNGVAANPHCTLTLGVPYQAYISTTPDGGPDTDWYVAQLGALTGRSLLHVSAGYTAPQTAVNFSVNVLHQDGAHAIAAGIDHHGAGAPKPVELLLPFSEANIKILVLVGDEGGTVHPRADNRNPYSVLVETLDNPDPNEPNDVTPTPITLTPSGGVSTGTQQGVLATANDVDSYSFTVTGAARQIVYVHVTDPSPPALPYNPPIPYRTELILIDPAGVVLSDEVMDNSFLTLDLATARLATRPGAYKVVVQGYKEQGATSIPGDLRLKQKVEVRVMPDVDPLEGASGNDLETLAHPVTLSLNTPTVLSGRISYVPDDEWFNLTLAANGQPTTLRYEVTVGATGGRFPPLPSVPSRQVRLETPVSGSTTQQNQVNCKTQETVCPKGYEGDTGKQQLVELLCSQDFSADGGGVGPMCLWAERDENQPSFGALKNFVGAIPIPPHGGPLSYHFLFRDQGRGAKKYADDLDWTIRLTWASDADEASRVGGPTVSTLTGAPTEAVGELTFGYGRILDPFDINSGQGIRSFEDYDAVPSDLDLFQFNLPTTDEAWSLEWDMSSPDGGTPGELALDLVECASGGPPPCPGTTRLLADPRSPTAPWYVPPVYANAKVLFTRQQLGNVTRVTLEPVACGCFGPPVSTAGHLYMNVGAANRVSNAPLLYRIRQSVSAYPSSYQSDGGTVSCPNVAPDGGVLGCGMWR